MFGLTFMEFMILLLGVALGKALAELIWKLIKLIFKWR